MYYAYIELFYSASKISVYTVEWVFEE